MFSSARSEEHTSELQSPVVISYAVFCLKKKKTRRSSTSHHPTLSFSSTCMTSTNITSLPTSFCCFFFNDTATTEIYTTTDTLSLHDALPISSIAVLESRDNLRWPADVYIE